MANQFGTFGFESDHSQKLVAGTRQRFSGPSQRLQCELFVLRMFVTGAPPYCGGQGIPQRIISIWRSPSTTRTIGAS
jgi:hypothetical protein